MPCAGGAPRATLLFCLWLAWSRFRVVIPTWDRTLPTLLTCLDTTLRRLGGAPTYALTDNEKTVTVEHVAGVAVRHPEMVAAGRHYGMPGRARVCRSTRSPRAASEATVRIAKADLVPTEANLRDGLPGHRRALVAACDGVLRRRSTRRRHRETGAVPAERLLVERDAAASCCPSAPYAAALGRDPAGQHRSDGPVRVGALLHPARAGRARRCGSAPPGTSWSSSPT